MIEQCKQKPHKQTGIVLVMTLIMVFILAGLAITISSIPTNDQRIAGNSRDMILAQQSANAAISQAKTWLGSNWVNNQSLISTPLSCGRNIQATTFNVDSYVNNSSSWWSSNGCSATTYPSGLASAPVYIIKYLGPDPMNHVDVYHIIARGVGVNPNTIAYADVITTKGVTGGVSVSSSTPGAKLTTVAIPHGGGASPYTTYTANGTGVGNFGWGGVWNSWCQQGVPAYGGCNRDASGRVQVWGYSGNDTPSCRYRVGPWTAGGASAPSGVNLPSGSGNVYIYCY